MGQVDNASSCLIGLLSDVLPRIKSFEAKQLFSTVTKLLLSLNTLSLEKALDVCLKGLDAFSEDKHLWQKLALILESQKNFCLAAKVHEALYRADPLSKQTLTNLVRCYKFAGMLDELEALKDDLANADLMLVDPNVFNWQANLEDIIAHPSEAFKDTTKAPLLTVPLKDLNWGNYAQTLLSMATGNYQNVFKKVAFDPEQYSILIGPCEFDIPSHQLLTSVSQGNTTFATSQVTSVMLSSQKFDFSNSMEDVAPSNDASSQRRRTATRRRERAISSPSAQRPELGLVDIIKLSQRLFNCTEHDAIDAFVKTEPLAIGLLDKHFIGACLEDSCSSSSSFTLQPLHHIIEQDNNVQKSVLYRIHGLVQYFFTDTLGHRFPESLAAPMQVLGRLFFNGSLPIDIFDSDENVLNLLLGIAEIDYDLNQHSFSGIEVSKAAAINPNHPRLILLQVLLSQSGFSSITLPEGGLATKYFKTLSSTVTSEQLQSHIADQNIIKQLDLTEKTESKETLLRLCKFDPMSLFSTFHGENRLRYSRLLLKHQVDNVDISLLCSIVFEELLSLNSAHMPFESFLKYLEAFLPIVETQEKVHALLLGLFWNILARKALLPTESYALTMNLFCNLLAKVIEIYRPTVDLSRNILYWAAQEKVLGCANGSVLFAAFNQLKSTDLSDCWGCVFFYSIAFSLYRFPNIFTIKNVLDSENCWEEWDRYPLGQKDFLIPGPSLSFIMNLVTLVFHIYEYLEEENGLKKNYIISEPSFISFVDWLKKQFDAVESSQVRVFHLNLLHIRTFLNANLSEHASGLTKPLLRAHFELVPDSFQKFRWALDLCSSLSYEELQGRKKPLDVLKVIRKDHKMALAIDNRDPDAWALLGQCYHDSALHLLSNDVEEMHAQLPKIRRLVRKGIVALWHACQLHPKSVDFRQCLVELIDWAVNEPINLIPLTSSTLELPFLCNLGLHSCKLLIARDERKLRWLAMQRFAEFFRLSSGDRLNRENLCAVAKEAVNSALVCLNENVYEQSALYHSLVEYYNLLFEKKAEDSELVKELDSLKLPESLKPSTNGEDAKAHFLKYVEALSSLDRRKVFHAHHWLAAMVSWKLCCNHSQALDHFSSLFPFLKKTRGHSSFMQIYQPDLDRPAWYLVSGHRYCLALIDFLCDQKDLADCIVSLELFLKKLFYARRTVYNFVKILQTAIAAYLCLVLRQQQAGVVDWPTVLPVIDELLMSLRKESNAPVPVHIKQLNRQVRQALSQ